MPKNADATSFRKGGALTGRTLDATREASISGRAIPGPGMRGLQTPAGVVMMSDRIRPRRATYPWHIYRRVSSGVSFVVINGRDGMAPIIDLVEAQIDGTDCTARVDGHENRLAITGNGKIYGRFNVDADTGERTSVPQIEFAATQPVSTETEFVFTVATVTDWNSETGTFRTTPAIVTAVRYIVCSGQGSVAL